MQYDRREVEFYKNERRAELDVGHIEMWTIFLIVVAMLLSIMR